MAVRSSDDATVMLKSPSREKFPNFPRSTWIFPRLTWTLDIHLELDDPRTLSSAPRGPLARGAFHIGTGDVTDIRSAKAPAPLSAFAKEISGLADRLSGTRFRGSERYVIDTDAVQHALRDISERMHRAASEAPPPSLSSTEPSIAAVFGAPANRMAVPALRRPVYTTATDQHGRTVRVERRRRV